MNDVQEYARRWAEDQRRAGMKPSMGLLQYPRRVGKSVLAEAVEQVLESEYVMHPRDAAEVNAHARRSWSEPEAPILRMLEEARERLWAQGIPPIGEPVTRRGQLLSYVEPMQVRKQTLTRCARAVRDGQVRRWLS